MRRLTVLLALVVLGANVWFWAQGRESSSELAKGIHGQVLDGMGRPVSGAVVFASAGGQEADLDRAGGYTATTSRTGSFELPEAGPGFWMIAATGQDRDGRASFGWVRDQYGKAAEVSLQVRHAEIVIHGSVKDGSGSPVAGASIRALRFKSSEPDIVFEAITSAGGSFELGLADDSYIVQARAKGFRSASIAASSSTTVELRLQPGARLEGRVLAGGEPVEGAAVQVFADDGNRGFGSSEDARSDRDGSFAFDSLAPGEYRVMAEEGNIVGFAPGSVLAIAAGSPSPIAVSLWPGRTITARVVDHSGVALRDAAVDFWQVPGIGGTREELVRDDGTVSFAGVLPWSGNLQMRRRGFMCGASSVDPTRGDVTGVTLTAERGARISGMVEDSAGAPVPDAIVVVRPKDGEHRFAVGGDRTNLAGGFEVAGLETGTYVVEARRSGRGLAVSDPVSVTCGCGGHVPGDATVDLQLHAGGTIRGTVRDADGRPVGSGVAVFGERRTGPRTDTQAELAVTDSAGRFVLRSLPPAEWFLAASRSDSAPIGLAFGLYPLTKSVDVSGAVDRSIELTLPPRVSIDGTVRSTSGPIQGATVRAFSGEHYAWEAPTAVSDSAGRFVLADLDSGRWRFSVVAPGFAPLDDRSFDPSANIDTTRPHASVDLHLDRSSRIEGVVVDEKGRPVTDYFVDESFGFSGFAVHGSSGEFVLDARRRAGHRNLVVKTPTGAVGAIDGTDVPEGTTKRGVRVVLSDGVTLLARLVDPVTGAPLETQVRVGDFDPSANFHSDKDGRVVVPHLPRGTGLYLGVMPPSGEGQDDTYAFTTPATGDRLNLGTLRPMPVAGDPFDHWNRSTVGVFAVWGTSGSARIVHVLPHSPAEQAGIVPGDQLLAVDGKDTTGIGSTGLDRMLSGPPGIAEHLTVKSAKTGTRKDMPVIPVAIPRRSHK